jgi:chromosome segregation ATPase
MIGVVITMAEQGDLTEEKTAQNYRYENLTEKQKNIVNSIDNIKAMSDELKRLAGENADLRQELYRERERNQEMINRLDRKPRARGHER